MKNTKWNLSFEISLYSDSKNIYMRGMNSCRKHNIHSRQASEQNKTKTIKSMNVNGYKNTEDTHKQTNIY